MKKVLVGICGIGNGHINRQICVIDLLIKNKYKVLIATEKDKIKTLENIFPKESIIEIKIPWIVCNENGVDFKSSLDKYNNIDLFRTFLEFSINVENKLGGKPDLIISDYEPNVAQYAYASLIPLITMEQQSKFLYLNEIEIADHSIKEEIYRLNYFFPKYDRKIISSFFPIDIKDKKVVLTPPIISKIEKIKCEEKFILVYLSPYSDSSKYIKLINILENISTIKFKLYSKNSDEYSKIFQKSNIKFCDFNPDFKNDLAKCSALITTGGHQLISEAISLDIPLYIIPLETYEQNYNACMVNKYKLGINKEISLNNIKDFLSNKDVYIKNIVNFKNRYYNKTWEELFLKEIFELINKPQ